MEIEKLRPDLLDYLQKHDIESKFIKQRLLLEHNPNHPSLHREKLIPKELNIYSFRIDRKYRAIFIVKSERKVEIVHISNHYKD